MNGWSKGKNSFPKGNPPLASCKVLKPLRNQVRGLFLQVIRHPMRAQSSKLKRGGKGTQTDSLQT
eukprot:scaffold26341_cov14-Tisochrysis_lutea.AAC.1